MSNRMYQWMFERKAGSEVLPRRLFGGLTCLGMVLSLAQIASQARADTVALQMATATYSQMFGAGNDWPVSTAINGIRSGSGDGWAIWRRYPYMSLSEIAAFETEQDVGFVGGTLLTFTLYQDYSHAGHLLGKFRLSLTQANRDVFADGLHTGGNVGDASIWTQLTPASAVSAMGATLTINSDNTILSGGANPGTDIYTITAFTSLTGITGTRLEVLEDASLPDNGPGRFYNGNFTLTEFAVEAEPIVVNADPIADAGLDQTVECTGALTQAQLDGTGSSDPDGDELTYEWSVADDSGAVINDIASPTPTGLFPVGPTLVTLTVSDGKGGIAVDDVLITVTDNAPPVVVCTTDKISLWPPDHRMVDVTIYLQVSDNATSPEDLLVDCRVSSSEPDDASGDGSFTGDVNGQDAFIQPVDVDLAYDDLLGCYVETVSLRAERDGSRAGRKYSITCNVIDLSGNAATASCVVVVPHDRRQK